MTMHSSFLRSFCLIAVSFLSITNSRGDIAMNVREVGSDVVFSYSGSINLTGIGSPTTLGARGLVYPVNALVKFGGPVTVENTVAVYTTAVANQAEDVPDNIGTGGAKFPNSFQGSYFSINRSAVEVPLSYVSGSLITGSMTFNKTTLAGLGLNTTNAPYEWVLANGQKVTLTVLDAVAGSRAELRKELKKVQKKLRNARKSGNAALVKKLLKKLKAVKADLKAL